MYVRSKFRVGGWPGLSQSFELTRVPRPSFAWAGPLTFFITNAMYEPSQTCSPIGAKISRQCTVENCATRSEEHTSELQSLTNLVCRLLLEKKTTKYTTHLYVSPARYRHLSH